jgi:hypothetical protein
MKNIWSIAVRSRIAAANQHAQLCWKYSPSGWPGSRMAGLE